MSANRNIVVSPFQSCRFQYGSILVAGILILISEAMSGKQELQAVIQGNGQFSTKLYNILAESSGNVFFSPISAHAVLAMAYQGAQGSTLQAFDRSLEISDHQTAATGYKDVMTYLNNVSDVQLLMANKIYVMQGYSLKPTFKESIENNFLSEVELLNFNESVASANRINSWVEAKTHDKIKDLIQPIVLNSLTRLVLVNAIYFKGNWASKFSKSATKTEKFYINDNDSVDVQMMNNQAKFFYKEDKELDAKVLELPYSNHDVSMIVILPNKRNGIADLEKKLTGTDIAKITENLFKTDVNVKLPKFKIETTIQLNEPLKKLGLGAIFEENANFSGMLDSPEPLRVSEVIQKAFIEVNEEGTEAAAATGIMIATMSFQIPAPPGEFIADHPFIVILQARGAIVDEERQARIFFNGFPLFQGRVSNPNA